MILAAIAGCTDPDPGTATPAEPEEEGAPPDVDVLIVGAGPAGLSAAVEATRAGASVLVLEREATWGGSALIAGALMMFSGTPQQEALGVSDSAEQLLAEWAGFTGGDTDDAWVRYFAEHNVPDVYDWLAGMGLTWNDPMTDFSSGPTPRVHQVTSGGTGLVDLLADQVPVSIFRTGTEAVDITQDTGGRVTGVRWRTVGSDETSVTTASAVIVATGGFMHDLDRVRRERPDLDAVDLYYGSWTGADGNGLTMLESHGAATQNLQAIGLYAHGAPAPGDTLDEMSVPFLPAVPWVNVQGERFTDESESNSFRTGAIRAAQPFGDAWVIFDAAIVERQRFVNYSTRDDYTFDEVVDAGLVDAADTIEGLAEALAVPSDTLAAEIGDFNAFALGEADDAFRDEPAQARPVGVAPFYALPIATSVAKGFGGIDTDLQGRVLDTDGTPIPGLYAAGELTGMAGGSLVGDYGFTGSMSAVVLGGRIAGRYAAEEAVAP